MPASIRSVFLKNLVKATAIPLAAFVLVNAGLDCLAHSMEMRHGYYLWKIDDSLLMFSEDKFRRSGKRRMMIFGDSAAGEGIDETTIERSLPGSWVDHMAVDGGSFDDIALQMNYLETAYGRESVPERIVIALSPRVVADILTNGDQGRFTGMMNKYSGYSSFVLNGAEWGVRKKDPGQALLARVDMYFYQGERYRSVVKILASDLGRLLSGSNSRDVPESFRKAKHRWRSRKSLSGIRRELNSGYWRLTHAWRASDHRDLVEREIGTLIEFAERNGAKLYLVNLPEPSPNKEMFPAGEYQDYIDVLRTAAHTTPVLDLGDLLTDDEFIDAVHPTGKGAVKTSLAIANFIRDTDRAEATVR